ncbi:GNAT family N-acetyltransferase [Paenibacillus sp. p3-SID867]|uniref:GNAT family N-acetyltransferase n=1 Tax=Paenibacillus sp. p3-SID867 TaxID=2916363 RepID=UPI0021A8CCB2|nr:GNAT family N-acetyltransferase [Paenibacillus sp. p3-SID867]MCT1401069.1 GNAT family N-acetyltransferase [Paenibacillus sp. p3-SID867]
MELRQLRSDEFEISTKLSEYAFQYTLTPEQRESNQKHFKPERFWGIFDGEELQAKLTIIPLQVYVHGNKFEMGGIAGVATWPENRRQGHVSTLLKHALQEMKSKGQTLSFLHPFSIPFYRKFGWELYAEYKKYTIPVSKFPRKVEVPGRIVRGVTDIPTLDGMYQAYASRYNGTLVRDEAWWTRFVLQGDNHSVVYYSAEGKPTGYALYELKDKDLVCDEFVYLNEEARSALWTFFGNHDSRIEQVTMTMVPGDDQLPFMLPDPRVTQEVVPYFMARIVDLKSFVEQYAFEAHQEAVMTIEVEDSVAPWNAGRWRLSVNQEGKAELSELPTDQGEQADLTTDIQTLSALFTGYKRPQALHAIHRLSGNPKALTQLETMIPAGQTYLMDFF